MKISISASDITQLQHAHDWGELLSTQVFAELERWLVSKEAEWGKAHVFLEAVMPRGTHPQSKRNNQFDLLICFDDRIALCEMKRGLAAFNKLPDAVAQIDGQNKWMQSVLRDYQYDDRALSLFLFCPHLTLDQLGKVRWQIVNVHSRHDIWAISSQAETRGQRDDERRSYYICEALEQRLHNRFTTLGSRQTPLAKKIATHMLTAGCKLLDFDSFAQTDAYLQSIAPVCRRFVREDWYVAGLFSETAEQVGICLKSSGLANVIGPPGSGKSTVVKEVIEVLDEDYIDLCVARAAHRRDIAILAHQRLRSEPAAELKEDMLLQSLAEEPILFWVQACDHSSASALDDFLATMRSMPGVRSRWLIESSDGVAALEGCQCNVMPLGNSAISQIIQKVRSGGHFADPEQVVDRAQGNPRRAIRLWRSRNERDAEVPDNVEWFLHQLSRQQDQLLPVICHAFAKSPLGVTFGLLKTWATVVFPDRPARDLENSLDTLLVALEEHQMARVSRLNRATFAGRLDALLPDSLHLTVIDHLAPDVLAAVSTDVIEQRLGVGYNALHEALLQSGDVDSLSFVASALLQGDLEPFFRSSFRSTSLPLVPDWCDRTGWHNLDPGQIYLLRALRTLSQVGIRPDIAAERDLGNPSTNHPLQNHVFAVAQARIAAYQRVPDSFNFETAVEEAHSQSDPDLRIEKLVSIARSLQRSERHAESWQVLNQLPARCPVGSAACFLAHYRRLEFLNRRKQRQHVLTDEEACAEIEASCRHLIEYAARAENHQAICDALFYFVRSKELTHASMRESDVADYGAALEFVELSRKRRVRRLQVLLTRGSLHRHACRGPDILWDVFRRHMDAGFIWYRRTLRSALAQNHLLHQWNALSYMVDFCLKATRFETAGATAVTAILSRSAEVAQLVQSHLSAPPKTNPLREEQTLVRAARRGLPHLLYLEMLESDSPPPAQVNTLRDRWAGLIIDMEDEYYAPDKSQLAKSRSTFLKTLERILRFGSVNKTAEHRRVLALIRPSLDELLEITKPWGGRKAMRDWQRVRDLI